MSSIYDLSQVRNHPSRSAFPLESHRPFTSKVGMILPVYWKLTYPGDSWSLTHKHFTRTAPVQTAAFGRFREYFDWYFVPLRLLSKTLPQALTQITNNPVQASDILTPRSVMETLPYCSTNALEQVVLWQCGYNVNGPAPVNFFGQPVASDTFRLLRHLNYGNFLSSSDEESWHVKIGYTSSYLDFIAGSSIDVNILPLLAYQKIYNDYFRFAQWEASSPVTWNVDYYTSGSILSSLCGSDSTSVSKRTVFVNSNNMFTLRYSNWNKDKFMGILPNTQLGEISALNMSFDDTSQILKLPVNTFEPTGGSPTIVSQYVGSTGSNSTVLTDAGNASPGQVGHLYANGSFELGNLATSFNILQLRMAEAVQRYREISQVANPDYVSQIKAHWDENVSKALSDQCIYIGGSATNLSISEVQNTALSDSAAIQKGKGIGSGQSSFKFQYSEYGILMCLYHCVPLMDYRPLGIDPSLRLVNISDIPQPEFDRIGLESEPFIDFANISLDKYNNLTSLMNPMGYLPRYYSLKTEVDYCYGAFETTLKDWVITLSPQYLQTWFQKAVIDGIVNYSFFKVNPSVCDSIFGVNANSTVDTDQFYVDSFFDVKRTSNFDYDGMPY